MHNAQGKRKLLAASLAALMCCGLHAVSAPRRDCAGQKGDIVLTRGSVVEDGMAGVFDREVELGSGRSRERVDVGVIRHGRGFDGHLAWSQDVSGATHDFNSDFARALAASQAWIDGHLGCSPGSNPGSIQTGSATDGADSFDTWKITPQAGAPVELWYNRKTHCLDRALLQESETRLVRHFTDWREIDCGHIIPFAERDEYVEDESETDFRVASAVVKTAAPSEDFRRPDDPRDTHILNPRQIAEIPYADDHRTRIYLPVTINGKGPFTFELDSGGHFILDADTARAVGLSPQGAFSATGAGNAVARAGFVRVRELRIGDAMISDQAAMVRAFSKTANDRGPRPPRAGILGLEIFERFIIGIDRGRKIVSLRLRGAPYSRPAGRPIPLVFDEDAPLIGGTIHNRAGNLMVDTGNAGSTIAEDYWAQRSGLAAQLARGLPAGDDVRYSSGEVALGGMRLPRETLSYYGPAQRGSEYTRSVAAVLGEPLLSRFDVTFDYGQNTVWLSQEVADRLPFNRSGMFLDKTQTGDFVVYAIALNSPASRADVRKGDIVSLVAGKPSSILSRADANDIFRQAPGVAVDLRMRSPASPLRSVRLTLQDLL